MNTNAQILFHAYQHFILNIKGKNVPIPYRINIPPVSHPARQGKSSPDVILKQLYEDSKEQGFDLKTASIEEIQGFMRKNNLGLDCSGFAYRMLDFLVHEIKGKPLTEFGLPHVGRTNVNTLTSNEFSVPVKNLDDTVAGDLIKFNSQKEIPHVVIVLENKNRVITYAHSSQLTKPDGVHQGRIIDGKLPDDLSLFWYNVDVGDGIRRLKALDGTRNTDNSN